MKRKAIQSRIGGYTVLLTAALLGGCRAVGPDYESPTAVVPVGWREQAAVAQSESAPRDRTARWWRAFEDPVLDRLISRALESGPDRRAAMARLREARALRGVAAGERFPALDAVAAYRESGESRFSPVGAAAEDGALYSAGLDASWEVDLWGRVQRSVEAADAELGAAAEEARGVFLAVAAETAVNYVELRAFQRRLAIARTNVALQEQTLQLVQSRFDAGFVGARDLAQASTNLAMTRSRVPVLEAGERAAENRLGVMLGVAPGTLSGELDAAPAIPVPPLTAVAGVPADVVRDRPDIRRAERDLAAAHARGGMARGDLYPRLVLGGSIRIAATDTDDLLRSGSDFFGIGPSVRWNLFDGARMRRRIEAQDARTEQALIRWERAVLAGLEESESAMTAFVREQTRRRELLDAATEARRAVDLARIEYREGQSDFQAVLDSERALAQIEDELAGSEAAVATQFVVLHKALGSG